MTDFTPLWSPLQIGSTHLDNRVALAPMTRISATEDGLATERMASYYRTFARGGFGLLITEGIYPDTAHSQGYHYQPGIATEEQTRSWATVVDGVHSAGARMFAQLMHAGAQSQGNRFVTSSIGPSAVAPRGSNSRSTAVRGRIQFPRRSPPPDDRRPERLRHGCAERQRAGFDGVEIHGANGYLLDQFLTDYLNQRTDSYGGSPENRVRFAAEICRDVRDAVGPDMTVGIRISQSKVSDNDHRWSGTGKKRKSSSPRWGPPASTSSTPRNTRRASPHSRIRRRLWPHWPRRIRE